MEVYNIDLLLQKARDAWRRLQNNQDVLKKMRFMHYSDQTHIFNPETWDCAVCGVQLEEGQCLWAILGSGKFLCVVHGSLDDEIRTKCVKTSNYLRKTSNRFSAQ